MKNIVKTILILSILACTRFAMAQSSYPPVLLVDVSGNFYPTGNGISISYTPPGVTCYTKVAGVVQGCSFSGGSSGVTSITGDGTIISNSASTGAVTLTLANTPTGTGGVMLANNPILGGAGAASTANLMGNGALFTGGSGTTTFPYWMIQPSGATAETGWNTAGTFIGVNSASGFTGNFIDFHNNNSGSIFTVSSGGIVTAFSTIQSSNGSVSASSGTVTGGKWASGSNCSSAASPAVCSSASAGSVVVAASATTVVVDTTAVTANSQVFVQEDSSLGTKLSVTCNTTPATAPPTISARTGGTSFTITTTSPTTNPRCFSFWVIN